MVGAVLIMVPLKPKARILFVDDDVDVVTSFVDEFSDEFEVIDVTSPEKVLARVDDRVAVAVVDQRMSPVSGIEVLRELRTKRPEVTRILLTAFADYDRLIAAVNEAGIFKYVAKPWDDKAMREILHQAAGIHRLREEDRQFVQRLKLDKQYLVSRDAREFAALIGDSDKLRAVIAQARAAADSDISVLIEGETGTGKELLAHAIHFEGIRRHQIFAPINCAAVSETLLQSQLFGHRRGSFTGATADQRGILEIADHGTVFLDEIGDMPPVVQAALLRFLQEGEVLRVGDSQSRRVDVRIIAATNRSLPAEIAGRRFREDLYYRINALQLTMPPLRDRPTDIPALARHLLSQTIGKTGKRVDGIADDAMQALCHYAFPGNVRQLKNEIERAVALAAGPHLALEDFSGLIAVGDEVPHDLPGNEPRLPARVREFERSLIRDALARADGNVSEAARELGITREWLHKRVRDFNLS